MSKSCSSCCEDPESKVEFAQGDHHDTMSLPSVTLENTIECNSIEKVLILKTKIVEEWSFVKGGLQN